MTGTETIPIEAPYWHDVSEHTCPECRRLPGYPCDFDGQDGLGFHMARVEAMKQEARRRAAEAAR